MTCLPNFPAMNLENQKFEGYKTCLKYGKYRRCICPLQLLPDIFKIPKMRIHIYILFHTTIIKLLFYSSMQFVIRQVDTRILRNLNQVNGKTSCAIGIAIGVIQKSWDLRFNENSVKFSAVGNFISFFVVNCES